MVPAIESWEVGNRWEPLYERFRKQQPLIFEGGPDPLKAEQWLTMITTILDFMRIEGHDRVACATYMLREDARIWWEVASQTRDVTTLSWEGFKDLFSQKYYNVSIRAAKVNEFVGLVQGNMTVTLYALKFDRLAKFAPDLVPTDVAR